MEWQLYDPNGNWAGQHFMYPQDGEATIETYIETNHDRPFEDAMPFGVSAWFDSPTSLTEATVAFQIEKAVPNCFKTKERVECKPRMKTENIDETKMFEVDSCYEDCDQSKPELMLLKPSDLNCQDLNDADWYKNETSSAWQRNFDCTWKGFET
ncbi:hypothetical protein ACEQ8H_008553 [Pleosporales sp. CAS-2024a]